MPAQIPAGCPAHIPASRQRVFDYATDPRKYPTPFDAYMEFRGEPSFWSPVAGGFWVLTDAASIRDMFQRSDDFSSHNTGLGYTGFDELMIPKELDPPEHKKYRSLLASWFTPNSAKRLEPAIRQACGSIIDSFAGDQSGDLIEKYLGVFPQTVFLEHILQLPVSELDRFLKWEHQMLRHPQVPAEAAAASRELRAYLAEVVADRSARPIAGDLLSTVLASEVDGRPVTEAEARNIAFLLFLAGLDTVTTALAFSFYFLATHPDKRAELNGNPALIEPAVEELLRYYSFVSPIRTAKHDMDFHGIPLKEGDRILPSSPLAARDPNEFPDPDDVIFTRASNRHMAFGAGPHRCLGSHLARIEMKVALEEFQRRIPDYELQPGVPLDFHAAGMLGLDNLPLRW